MWPHVAQTTSKCGLSDPISDVTAMRLGNRAKLTRFVLYVGIFLCFLNVYFVYCFDFVVCVVHGVSE